MMERIPIQDLAAILVTKSGLKKKDAERFAMLIFEVVKDGLATDRLVKVKGLGTFKVIDIESRESVDVNTGERVLIEGHDKITFIPDATMKELVNKPFSQFETVVLNEGVVFDDTVDETGLQEEEAESESEPEQQENVEVATEEPTPFLEFVDSKELLDTEDTPEEVPLVEEPPAEEPPVEEPPAEEPPVEELSAEVPPVEGPPIEEPPIEEPLVEEPVEEENTNNNIEEIDSNENMEENGSARLMSTKGWIVALLACIGTFVAGYLIGYNTGKSAALDQWVDEPAVVADSVIGDTAVVDESHNRVASPDTISARAKSSEKAEPVPVPVTSKESVAKEKDDDSYSKYEQMDVRVRTGAYRIVGTAQEVKVKGGDTVARISKRYLGPDMECYIEVYNGLKAGSQLQVGQTIKIPKLELKKKKKQQTN